MNDNEPAKLGRIRGSMSEPSIIVIGPDRVGKTTIAGEISHYLHVPLFKCPNEKKIFLDGEGGALWFDLHLADLLKQTGHRIISDRGYPCEMVYSQVFGRKTNREMLSAIDKKHAELGTVILYIYASVPPTEEDELVDVKFYDQIRRGYEEFCDWTDCRVVTFDSYPYRDKKPKWTQGAECITRMGLWPDEDREAF